MTAPHNDNGQVLQAANLAFAGRVTASVTHELNNVLSTVGELSGLLEDVAAADPAKGGVSQERLERIATGLLAQVKRGAQIIKRLNRFAHSSDTDIQSADLREVVALMAGLAEPLIRRHSVTLETQLGDAAITIRTHTFLLEQLLYLWIDEAASASERGQTVSLICRPHAEGGVVEIVWTPKQTDEQSAGHAVLPDILAVELQGEVENSTAGEGTLRRAIALPQTVT